MDGKTLAIFILVILLVFCIWIIRNFFKYYVDPLDYKPILYEDIQLKTGDLIFVRRYSSPHVFISGEIFSHTAIVIVLEGSPYVLELSHPHIYLMPFQRFLLGFGQGQILYIRQLKKEVYLTDRDVSLLLKKAKEIKYTRQAVRHYLNLTFKSNEEIINQIEENKRAICCTFILWVMNELGLLSEEDLKHKNGTNVIEWLSQHEKYGDIRRLSFFKKTLFFKPKDYYHITLQTLGLEEEMI